MKDFKRLLLNTLIAGVTSNFLWFAVTFWIYLETRNVMATAILGGAYMAMLALTGILFGTFVDKHKKRWAIGVSSFITAAAYLASGAVFFLVPSESISTIGSMWFWIFTILILAGTVAGNIRGIALSTCVSIMVPEGDRAKANGMVGMVQGMSFMVTSIFSGLAIGYLGMEWTMAIAIALTVYALVDLIFVKIDEDHIEHDPNLTKHIDISGAWRAIRATPGLLGLIMFATFNNLIGGVYMALLDPYGLTLMSVQLWGILYAISSVGFIVGGALVSKLGLTKKPLRILLLVNLIVSVIGLIMGIRESIWLLSVSMFIYMALIPIAEAAEQTVLQKVVPVAKQGRVFGFGSSVEALAAPISAFLVGPLAQYMTIPYMNTAQGHDTWGWLLGDGESRGIALLFVAASIFMAALVLIAFRSRSYKGLSAAYAGKSLSKK